MEVEEVEELIGKPDSIIDLNVFFYNSHQRIITHKGVIESVDLHVYQDLSVLDKIRINFNGGSMHLVNIALAIIMFGIALEIKIDHFKQVIKHPKSILVGIFSQFFALPALTFLLIVIIKPTPSVAMGLILVAASPGGNISNFMTSMAKGNSALSVSLTAVATVASVFMTPANFTFWGNLYSETSESMIPIQIDALQMTQTVILILGIPIALGIVFGHYFEKTTAKIVKPLKIFSIVFFIILIVGALVLNLEFIVRYLHLIALLVLVHNFIALATGYSLATIFKLPRADRRTITIETGIQNSGLALVLIFNPKLFDGLGGMAFIAAWWGIWHIISGLIMSTIWRRRKL
ncbi:MAG: bile acid:sodium symporter family protein [Ichthyobacteriaceae bacterium]|nr:bile acid:sodium symporter family protein [Ichthyobacteriaceae bacterium]